MIPLGSSIIFYPVVCGRKVEAAGTIRATNQLGAFVSYCFEGKCGTIGSGREPRNGTRCGDWRPVRGGDWRGWGIEPVICRSYDGISGRVDRRAEKIREAKLKALGNAVVPQQAYFILKAIAEASK